jgi:hypothetical protein
MTLGRGSLSPVIALGRHYDSNWRYCAPRNNVNYLCPCVHSLRRVSSPYFCFVETLWCRINKSYQQSSWAGVAQSVWLLIGRPTFDSWQRQRIFVLASGSRLVQGPTQPPVQYRGFFSAGQSASGAVYLLSPQAPYMACSGTAEVLS